MYSRYNLCSHRFPRLEGAVCSLDSMIHVFAGHIRDISNQTTVGWIKNYRHNIENIQRIDKCSVLMKMLE